MYQDTDDDKARREFEIEQREIAAYKRLQGLLQKTEHDGAPFGVEDDDVGNAYLLHIGADGHAQLHHVVSGVVGEQLVYVPRAMWPEVAKTVDLDFNLRLISKGHKPGQIPQRGGTTLLHPCFGRELEMAMIAGIADVQLTSTLLHGWKETRDFRGSTGPARASLFKRWKAILVEDPSARASELVKLLYSKGVSAMIAARERAARLDGLCRYVLGGEQSALDNVFRMEALAQTDRTLVKRLVAGAFGDDTGEERLARKKLVAEAMAFGAARRAAIAQMVEAA